MSAVGTARADQVRPRLLVVDPCLEVGGGGGAVVAWALQALAARYDVTFLSWNAPDLAAYDRYYGTALSAVRFTGARPPATLRAIWNGLSQLDPDPFSVQRWALLMRFARRMRPRFPAAISFSDETDFGELGGLQYVHYPYLAAAHHHVAQARRRRRPWQWISGFSFARVATNRTLVNSDWTRAVYSRLYGEDAPVTTLFPPVATPAANTEWDEREQRFVCLGRFRGDKRVDDILEILDRVRVNFPLIRLDILGSKAPDRLGREYYSRLRECVERRRDWVRLREDLDRDQVARCLSRARFGIHAKRDEHFGIAVGEMVRAGCITFVHGSGGAPEIVADGRLVYNDVAHAVAQISAVLASRERQVALRRHLARRGALFTEQRFMNGLTRHVAAAMEDVTGCS